MNAFLDAAVPLTFGLAGAIAAGLVLYGFIRTARDADRYDDPGPNPPGTGAGA